LKGIVGNSDRAAEIIAQTGGVPLLALEVIAVDDAGSEDLSGVERCMESKLRDASELSKQVLATAAVLTGVCDASLLKRTSGRSEEEVVEAVEELTAIGLAREVPEGEELSFTLDSLEKLLYDSLSLIRRRLLHRRAGEALAERTRSATDPLLAAGVAGQFRGAGDPRAADWYRVAGDLARSVYASTEAQSLYETAIALGSAAVGELHLGLGDLAMTRGDLHNRNTGADCGSFNRSHYEAQRVIDSFAAALQDEPDLENLVERLQTVVIETMGPSLVGIWDNTGVGDGTS
jgi:hypothetical protein